MIDSYIHGDRFREVADFIFDEENTPEITGDGVVFFHTHKFGEMIEALNHHRHIFVSHNSDNSATPAMMKVLKERSDFVHWYAQNPSFIHRDITPIPIGLERPGVGTCGDTSKLVNTQSKELKIYMNFSIGTNKYERTGCFDALKEHPLIVDDMSPKVSFEEHCKRMSACKFVVSPRGNGLDCIRTWEALYQGVVPIVKRSPLAPMLSYFPVLIVDSWDDLYHLDLEVEYEYLTETNDARMSVWRTNPLNVGAWTDKILTHWMRYGS